MTGKDFMDHRDIAIIGGDRRIAYMAPILLREGYRVICHGTADLSSREYENREDWENVTLAYASTLKEALGNAGTVICGIPLEKNGFLNCSAPVRPALSELQRRLRKRQKLFAGIIPDDFRIHCEERAIECHDFMKDEPLTLFNAVATAEGAILEALSHKECLLHQSQCRVLGYGRCGSLIAERLRGLCANIFVSTDNPTERARAEACGCISIPLSGLEKNMSKFDYVFNTIPACYLGENCLPKARRECLIIDVASGKTGVDYELAKELSLNALFCPGLPGKYAARSCAERLVKYVLANID